MTKTTRTPRRSRRSICALVLVGALALVATASVAEDGRCYTAEIPQTLSLPDGSAYPPGSLRICRYRVISPVSHLHRIYIDGQPIGMFLSVPRDIEETIDHGTARFVFDRRGDRLRLVAWAVGAGNVTKVFDLADLRPRRTYGSLPEFEARAPDETVFLVARAR